MASTPFVQSARACRDCSKPLDTSLSPNVRFCARDAARRRALSYLRAALPFARRVDDKFEESIHAGDLAGRALLEGH